MNANIGSTDKVIRIVGGVVVLALGLIFKTFWGLLGLLPIVTAMFNFCPLYSMLKMSTKKSKTE